MSKKKPTKKPAPKKKQPVKKKRCRFCSAVALVRDGRVYDLCAAHHEKQLTQKELRRRAEKQKVYTCRLCGGQGHNSRRHAEYRIPR